MLNRLTRTLGKKIKFSLLRASEVSLNTMYVVLADVTLKVCISQRNTAFCSPLPLKVRDQLILCS